MITVGEFCNRRVVTIRKTETVLEAARRLRARHVGSLVIVEERGGKDIPVGILTDRDIVVGALAQASPYLDSLQAGDLAIEPLVTAVESERLVDALRRMRKSGIRRMPVVNEEGALVGLVAFDDLLELVSEELSELAALVAREQRQEAQKRI